MAFAVILISATDVLPLRHAVLRPGRPAASAIFDGDTDLNTVHLGAHVGNVLVGVATLLPRPTPGNGAAGAWQLQEGAWQLRGMAVEPTYQRHGVGTALVYACVGEVAKRDGKLIWCNARLAAVPFYERLGFEVHGDEFDIPDVGPHFRMFRPL